MLSSKFPIDLEIFIQLNSLTILLKHLFLDRVTRCYLHLVTLPKHSCFSWIKLCQRLFS